MNFQELYQPYATKEAPSVSEQIQWLLKQGIPQNIIDQALVLVYTEIEKGKTFPNAKDLWLYLKGIATDLQKKESEAYLKNLEKFQANLTDKIDLEWNKLTKWQKVVEVIRGRA